MNVHAIYRGQTTVVWDLEGGQGHRDIGSSPMAHWFLPDCPDLLCRVEVVGRKLVVTELGQADIRVNDAPAGFRVELENGVRSACSVGNDWALVVTLDPPNREDEAMAAIALARASSGAALTAGTPEVHPPVRAIALKIFHGRKVEIIEASAGITFGRDETCDYGFDHPFVSRFHAMLVDGVEGISIRHVGKSHPTWVGLKDLKEGESELLKVGSVVRLSDAFGAPHMEVLELSEVAREKAKLDPDGSLVGDSAEFLEAVGLAREFASGPGPILLLGERGTGKSALARMLAKRARPGKPFVTVDCGSIPETLIESELNGHEKGAFTGALKRKGLIQEADGGVIFLDEVGEMPLLFQTRLLRTLNDRVVRPVGSERDVPVDVFFIVATNRDPEELEDPTLFRPDLLDRFGKSVVRLPALREHKSDIPAIANACLATLRQGDAQLLLSDDAAAALLAFDWPGNVRELRSVIQAAALRATGRYVDAATIQAVVRNAEDAFKTAPPLVRQGGPEAEPFERAIVVEALRRLAGKPDRQAQAAGLAVERAIVEAAIERSGGKGSDSLWAELGYDNKWALQRRRQKWGI